MKKTVFAVLLLNLLFLGVAQAKDQKLKIDEDHFDFIAVRGGPWNLEYFIDRKAKLCFISRTYANNVTMATVPCQSLLDGYAELKSVITWK